MEVSVDTKPLTSFLTDFEQRQVPFALANSLNDTAKLFQDRQQQHMGSIFTVRRQDWVNRSVKITKFAKKGDLVASVAIESPGGGARSDILGKFETQTQKRPRDGHTIAIPVEVKRSKQDIITAGNRPKGFNFREVGGARRVDASKKVGKRTGGGILRGALKVYEGDKRTVMIRNQKGGGVILQRVGTGKRAGMRLLYFLTPMAKLTPNLSFAVNAREAATHFAGFFAARFREAMHSAR